MGAKESLLLNWGITLCLFAITLWLPFNLTFFLGLISLLFVCRIAAWFIAVEIEDRYDSLQ
jgi:hypothetical protein